MNQQLVHLSFIWPLLGSLGSSSSCSHYSWSYSTPASSNTAPAPPPPTPPALSTPASRPLAPPPPVHSLLPLPLILLLLVSIIPPVGCYGSCCLDQIIGVAREKHLYRGGKQVLQCFFYFLFICLLGVLFLFWLYIFVIWCKKLDKVEVAPKVTDPPMVCVAL